MKTQKDILILGIESSCDETAAAVVRNGREVLTNVIATSADIHKQFGGVVPEIAARMHVEFILEVISKALDDAHISLEAVDAISVTYGPGLAGALLVGLSAAKALTLATAKPLIGVHHIAGHIAANYLADPDLKPPFLALVVSGGHTQLVKINDYVDFEILGTTRDDAAGEAFDKISRALGLGYPGGPVIDRMAQKGNPEAIKFPKTKFPNGCLDFSFSGVKTAALTFVQKTKQQAQRQGLNWDEIFPLNDFIASYQESVLQALIRNTAMAIENTGIKQIVLAGGVSANSRLRTLVSELAVQKKIKYSNPPLSLCTDNAAMIAAMGYYAYIANPEGDDLNLNAYPNLTLKEFSEKVQRSK